MKYAILGFLWLLLLLSAWEIKDFALPVWDIDLRIPLINDRYYTSELIDSLHIVSAADSVLQIVTTGELSTDEIFSVSLTPDVQINDISIPAGLQLNIKVPLQDTENNVQLSYGILTGGGLRYRFEDLGQDYDSMILRFEDIHNASGEVLQISAEGEQWVNLDLSGFSIGSYDSMEILDSLSITVICDSSVPEGTPVAAFSIDMSQALLFGIFQGLIVHMELGATDPAATLDVDYPLNIDQAVTLSTASIVINLSNELGFSTVFSGWFEARRDDQVVRVPILDDNGENYRIPAASGLNPGEVTLRFHDNISALMQIMPYHIELVQAKFVIDDESGFGTLNIENEIRADYTVEAPFRFTLHELPIEVDSVLTLEISEENRERIDQNLIDAGLEVQLKTPFQLVVQPTPILGQIRISTPAIQPAIAL
jgi:hypothetical protein